MSALRAFEAASRLGSLKAAAVELGVTPAAVSHQVKALEDHLGAALFERLHRSLRLTPAGERLGKSTQSAFAQISRALADLSSEGLIAGRTTLSISAAPTFAARWLAPRLHAFQAAHPTIEIRLSAETALVDFASDRGADIALRYGSGPYDRILYAEKLWPSGEVFPVCAPSLAGGDFPSTPCAVLGHSLLRTASPPGPIGGLGWSAWFAAAGVTGAEADAAVRRGPLFGSTHLALEAAATGCGIALAPGALVADDIRAGRLVPLFSISIADPYGFWLLFRRDRADEARIRAFTRWIKEAAQGGSHPGRAS